MTMPETGGNDCCKCCFSFTITLGLTALFLWLSLRIDEPKCYIDSFYVPALNKSLNSKSNNTVFFTMELENGNKDKGIKYDDVILDFAMFLDRNTTRRIGNFTIGGFYQGHQKDAKKPASFQAHGGDGGGGGINRTTAAAVDGKVYFRVDFKTAVKYKILFWYTKRHHLWGGANVEIGDDGGKTARKGIRLGGHVPVEIVSGSGARKLDKCYCAPLVVLGLLVNFLLLGLLC